jgi:uncharacterized membrane protein YfcA
MGEVDFVLLLAGLFVVAVLYSSVGHGGASGYLAVMSLTSFAMMDAGWLKQHAWFLNILVASLAFYHYQKEGHHNLKLTIPFIIASIPMAFIGGFLLINGIIYDVLLSLALIFAAWRLIGLNSIDEVTNTSAPSFPTALPWGAGIGFASGMIGVGGGIFLSPVLMLKKWAAPKTIAATAAVFICVNSIASLAGATASGQLNLDLDILLKFTIVVIIGGFIGSSYGSKIAPQNIIRKMLVVVLLIASAKRLFGLFALII